MSLHTCYVWLFSDTPLLTEVTARRKVEMAAGNDVLAVLINFGKKNHLFPPVLVISIIF